MGVDMSPARRSLLVQVFQQMDNTGNGSISIAEYRSAVASQTMLSFFEYLDAQGVAEPEGGDGECVRVRLRRRHLGLELGLRFFVAPVPRRPHRPVSGM